VQHVGSVWERLGPEEDPADADGRERRRRHQRPGCRTSQPARQPKRPVDRQQQAVIEPPEEERPAGPVPQAAYDLTKVLDIDASSDLFANDVLRATLRHTGNALIPSRDADTSKLSAVERQSLDWAIKYCGSMTFEQTKTVSHDSAYRATQPNAPMAMEDIVRMLPEAAQRRFFG